MILLYQLIFSRLNATKFFLALSITFFCNTLFAKDELMVVVGLAKPPYVIQADDSGYELDLIRNVVKAMGMSTTFVYTQFGHSLKMLDVKEIDAVMTTNQKIFSDESKLSDEYITYQNVAISLKSNNLHINAVADLANYSIASFQKADKVLGKAFSDAVGKSPLYLKIADQSQQPMLLLKKRVEVLIMDKNIFNYFAGELDVNELETLFTFHKIFPETHYRMAFKEKENVQNFNDALSKYKQSTEYLSLKKKYNLSLN